MSNKYNIPLAAMLALVMATGAAVNLAQASESKEDEAKELRLFSEAQITLQDAIKAAEQKTGGKAMQAELKDESNTVQFEIEIVKEGKVYEAIVDGKTGQVLNVSLED